jgi:hypothetical protein
MVRPREAVCTTIQSGFTASRTSKRRNQSQPSFTQYPSAGPTEGHGHGHGHGIFILATYHGHGHGHGILGTGMWPREAVCVLLVQLLERQNGMVKHLPKFVSQVKGLREPPCPTWSFLGWVNSTKFALVSQRGSISQYQQV